MKKFQGKVQLVQLLQNFHVISLYLTLKSKNKTAEFFVKHNDIKF